MITTKYLLEKCLLVVLLLFSLVPVSKAQNFKWVIEPDVRQFVKYGVNGDMAYLVYNNRHEFFDIDGKKKDFKGNQNIISTFEKYGKDLLAVALKDGGGFGLIDIEGNFICPPTFQELGFDDIMLRDKRHYQGSPYLTATNDGKFYGVIDQHGNGIVPFTFKRILSYDGKSYDDSTEIYDPSIGLVSGEIGGNHVLMDTLGAILISSNRVSNNRRLIFKIQKIRPNLVVIQAAFPGSSIADSVYEYRDGKVILAASEIQDMYRNIAVRASKPNFNAVTPDELSFLKSNKSKFDEFRRIGIPNLYFFKKGKNVGFVNRKGDIVFSIRAENLGVSLNGFIQVYVRNKRKRDWGLQENYHALDDIEYKKGILYITNWQDILKNASN